MFFTRPKPPKPMPLPEPMRRDPASVYFRWEPPDPEEARKRREMIDGLRLMEAQGYHVKLPLSSGKPRMVKMSTPRGLARIYY